MSSALRNSPSRFFDFHGAILIVIDDTILAFAAPEAEEFLNDFFDGVGIAFNRA